MARKTKKYSASLKFKVTMESFVYEGGESEYLPEFTLLYIEREP